ncbi:MAG: hypothetical protein JW739_02860 [Opitutales bacterium]|nr:hypothetical protein [Opitutales bacterium]
MKTITITIPDQIYSIIEAKVKNMDVPTMASLVLTEVMIDNSKYNTPLTSPSVDENILENDEVNSFNVRKRFKGMNIQSLDIAQVFVDEVLKYESVTASKSNTGRGIRFDPNFVFIEYLKSRGEPGIRVSFYGKPNDFDDPHHMLKSGMGSYSRADLNTLEEVELAKDLIRQSWVLKFG